MQGWTILAVLLAVHICVAHSFSVVYSNAQEGRKLFGGYRISPKSCSNGKSGFKGICMFNYECAKRRGVILGSCMDGFLFGTCCQLAPGVPLLLENNMFVKPTGDHDVDDVDTDGDYMHSTQSFYQTSFQNSFARPPSSRPPASHHAPPTVSSSAEDFGNILRPIDSHPEAETILFHQNGSAVQDLTRPEDFAPPKSTATPSHDFNTFTYVSSDGTTGDLLSTLESISQNYDESAEAMTHETSGSEEAGESMETKPGHFVTRPEVTTAVPESAYSRTTTEGKHSYFTNSIEDKIETLKPFDFEQTTQWPWTTNQNKMTTSTEEAIGLKTTTDNDFTPSYYSSRWPTNQPRPTISFRPRPTTSSNYHTQSSNFNTQPSTFNTQPSNFNTQNSNDNMILLPTIHSTKPGSQSTSSTQNHDSINSILSMLDENNPVEIATLAEIEEKVTTSKKPGIITWASLNNNKNKVSSTLSSHYKPTTPTVYFNTPTKRPSQTTTLHVPGPSFDVTLAGSQRPVPAPTVIVLGPFTSDFTTSRPSPSKRPIVVATTNKIKVTTQSFNRPPTNRPLPAGGLVTKRPTTGGIIVKRPTTSTVNIVRRTTTLPPSSTITKRPTYQYETGTSSADLSNFPPVRNPSFDTGRPPSQVQTETPDDDLVRPPPYFATSTEEAEFEGNTPIFLEDDKLDDKVGVFVNKIVESLQGNFQDLEEVLYSGQNGTTGSTPTKRPISQADDVTTKRPATRPPTKRPSQRPPQNRPTPPTASTNRPRPSASTPKPKPSASTSVKPQRPRPTKPSSAGTTTKPFRVSTVPSVAKPQTSLTTKRPKPSRRPTTEAVAAVEVTTKRPRPSKPKPSRKPTTGASIIEEDEPVEVSTKPPKRRKTTTSAPVSSEEEEDEEVDEEDEEDEDETTSKPADYRRECGVRPLIKRRKNGRIVGGKGSTFGQWPWQVLVRESTWLGLFTKNKCGGVLITNKFVITAAHCQPGFLANLVAVFGEYDISGELESKRSVTKNVRRVIVHRNYDAATFANDLALLELDSAVTFDQHIVPICMPGDSEDFTGRMATVSGWGRLKYGGGVPSVLQEVNVPIIENTVCQEMFHTAGHSKTILESFLCAGYANGQKDSCEGDSGGPLMLERDDGRWTLAGTVSHGIKCAAPYLPGVYMRTTFYKPWLKTITGVDNNS